MPLELDERRERLRNEMLVEVGERRIQLRDEVGLILVTVGVSPVVPQAGAENAPFHVLAQNERVTRVAVSVEFIDGAGLRGARVDDPGVFIQKLLVPIAGRISLGIEEPPV